MESLMSNERECLVCKSTRNLHKHHIFFGSANRKQSEKYGCWCYLCARHHNMSSEGVHFNKELDQRLKKHCQSLWELEYYWECQTKPREDFIEIFGRSYL